MAKTFDEIAYLLAHATQFKISDLTVQRGSNGDNWWITADNYGEPAVWNHQTDQWDAEHDVRNNDREPYFTSRDEAIAKANEISDGSFTMTRNGQTIRLTVVLAEGWNLYEVRRERLDENGAVVSTYRESQHTSRERARGALAERVKIFRGAGWVAAREGCLDTTERPALPKESGPSCR